MSAKIRGRWILLVVISFGVTAWFMMHSPAPVQVNPRSPSSVTLPQDPQDGASAASTAPGRTVAAAGSNESGQEKELPATPGDLLRIHVQDVSGESVHGALVSVLPYGLPSRVAGRTDAQGDLEIQRDGSLDVPGSKLVATFTGFAPDSRLLPEGSAELTFILHPANSISGSLQFHGAPLARAGLRVIVHDPSTARIDQTKVYDPADPELDSLAAETDAEGRFTIPGVRSDRGYFLYAGGQGYYSPAAVGVGDGSSRSEVVVPVQKVFGALLRFVDEAGVDLPLPAGFHRAAWWRSQHSEPQSDYEPGESSHTVLRSSAPYIGLSGLDPALVVDLPPNCGLHLVVTDDPFPIFHRRIDRGRPPGFEEYAASYDLRPVESGLEDVSIPLRMACEGWGNLKVRFVDSSSGEEIPVRFAPVPGHLRMFSLQQPGGRIGHGLASDSSAPAGSMDYEFTASDGTLPVLEGIPYGEYRVSYGDAGRTYEHPGHGKELELVRIGPHSNELLLSVQPMGAVEISLFRPDGTPYEGDVFTMIAKRPSTGSRPNARGAFSSPSPCVRRLGEGVWTFTILLPRVTVESGSRAFDVEVVAGQVARVSRIVKR